MPCYYPLQAFYTESYPRSVDFCSRYSKEFTDSIPDIFKFSLPCRHCIGCKLEYSRQWSVRCMHEASLYERNCFITLTYSPEYLPADLSLHHEHFQLFMKRLRKKFGSGIRFYMCGEYGSKNGRPHYHACLFNFDFSDKRFFKCFGKRRSRLYVSDSLSSLWGLGFCTVGLFSPDTAAYVARYVIKKCMNDDRKSTYVCPNTGLVFSRELEYSRMSLKPGIAFEWYEKFKDDVFPSDFVVMNGKKVRPPIYYLNLLKNQDPDLFYSVKLFREEKLMDVPSSEFTPDRLASKEQVCRAKIRHLNRSLDMECV